MATLQSLIDQAIFIAGVDNADVRAEALVPIVFQEVAEKLAANPEKRSLLNRTQTVTLTSGVGSVSEAALTGCKFSATVSDPNDSTVGPLMSLVVHWNDFISPMDTRLGYWTIKGDRSLHWIEPGATYDPASGKTGNISLTIATVPTVPASPSSTISVDDEILSDLIAALAAALQGNAS